MAKLPRITFRNTKIQNFKVHSTHLPTVFKNANLNKDDIFRVVVQPDTHVPEHDVKAINAFCKFLNYYKPHGLVNLGDFMEMGSVSHWDAHSEKPRRLVPEITLGRSVLNTIGLAAGKQCVFKKYLIGNHEDWLNQYLTQRVPEMLDGLEDLDDGSHTLTVSKLLNLDSLGYKVVPLNEILEIGNANFIHGYYTGMHHASKHLNVFGCNIYYGHLHDIQGHAGVSVKGLHEAASLGCLRTLNAPFLKGKPHNWAHAFGVFEFRIDGSYTRYIPIMVNGKFSFNGKLFQG